MRIASVIVCGLIFLTGTACQQQQQQQAEAASAMPEEVVSAPETKKNTRKNKKKKQNKLQQQTETAAAPDSSSAAPAPVPAPAVATAAETKAAASSITPRKPGLRVSRVQTPQMLVALTFDDGPSSAHTPRVLDILRRHGAKGTFFVLGSNAKRCSSIVARAASEGHEVGVHTWSHINMARSSMSKIDSEVSRTSDVIRSITGKTPVVMRPPYGSTTAGIVKHMYDRYGMRSIMWDVDTQDWRKPGVSTVVSRAVNNAKPGSIILVHDIHASTLAAVEGIVTGLQARGFKLVTVSQLMASVGVYGSPKVAPVVPPAAEETTPGAIDVTVTSSTETPAPVVASPAVDTTTPAPVSAEPTITTTQEQPTPEPVAEPAVNAPVAEPIPAVEPASATTEEAAPAL